MSWQINVEVAMSGSLEWPLQAISMFICLWEKLLDIT